MNKDYLVYNTNTGRIIQSMSISPEALEMANANLRQDEGIIVGVGDFMTDYVKDGQATPRPTITISKTEIVADGVDVALIDLGEPFAVVVDGDAYEIEDGSLEFSTDMPGVYTLEIDHFPYMPFKQEVTAHAP